MASSTTSASSKSQQWSTEFDTLRRQDLFRNPPSTRTAYPMLAAAIAPHIDSYNGIFSEKGQLHHAIRDIGTKTFFDGDSNLATSADGEAKSTRNRLQVRVREVFLDKSLLPPSNKLDKKREVLPVECRERHVTYRGRFRGRFEWRINEGEWKESVREFGTLPIMLRVRLKPLRLTNSMLTTLVAVQSMSS